MANLPQEDLPVEELHQVHLGFLDIIHGFSHDMFKYCPSGVMSANDPNSTKFTSRIIIKVFLLQTCSDISVSFSDIGHYIVLLGKLCNHALCIL